MRILSWSFLSLILMSLLATGSSDSLRRSSVMEPHANCCLCMCRAKDETKCSRMCIRLQHGKKIIYGPAMIQCTKECKKHGVGVTV